MPWCPKCRVEYRQGFKTCSDCNSVLVNELEPIKTNSNNECDDEAADDEAAYLTSVSNKIEAEMLEALLNSSGIPVLKKSREAGGYLDIYMGATIYGVDLFVPSRLLEKAGEIIACNSENIEEDAQQDYSEEEDSGELGEQYKDKRRTSTWVLLIFCIGLLWLVVTVLDNLFHWVITRLPH